MLAELILTYYFISNEPLYLRTPREPYAGAEIKLNVSKEFYDRYFIMLSPYVVSEQIGITPGRAGAEFEAGFKIKDMKLSFYHESVHNLDREGRLIEIDGVRLRWKLR